MPEPWASDEERQAVAAKLGVPFIGDGVPDLNRGPRKVRSIVERDGSVWLHAVELAEELEARADEGMTEVSVRAMAGRIREVQTRTDERRLAALEEIRKESHA